ncbi:hypothetical protein NA56DRAFT_740324 [Hyaloscypha hepaticicola]|uniref:DUF7702 domain-containing protein n=1 Tax=Hyaloscypha hepaticicola TaxID=2082293 RepID=A0A2J6PFG7_9HELO|nr:hypothetical protein NA56DRAFT_740324 [Hyaloscypha hepaticicola]
MTLSNLNDLSIVELIGYTPACFCSTLLCIRHVFGLNKGWIFPLIFSLIRIAGASLELATIYSPASVPLLTSATLLSSIGLSPLLLTTLGLLNRACKNINKKHHTLIHSNHTHNDNSANYLTHHGTYPIQHITKIGIIILIAVFAVVVLITGIFIFNISHAEPGERRLIYAITASIPCILIRLIYVVLITFSHTQKFSVLHGSVVTFGCMVIMPELIAVIIYLGVGFTLPRKTKELLGVQA